LSPEIKKAFFQFFGYRMSESHFFPPPFSPVPPHAHFSVILLASLAFSNFYSIEFHEIFSPILLVDDVPGASYPSHRFIYFGTSPLEKYFQCYSFLSRYTPLRLPTPHPPPFFDFFSLVPEGGIRFFPSCFLFFFFFSTPLLWREPIFPSRIYKSARLRFPLSDFPEDSFRTGISFPFPSPFHFLCPVR